jgi:hypothetical protein
MNNKVLELVNLSREARGFVRVNQGIKQIDLETATLPDLLLAESVNEDTVTYRTKKEARAVAKAWAEALPNEYSCAYPKSIKGYTIHLPYALRNFMNS